MKKTLMNNRTYDKRNITRLIGLLTEYKTIILKYNIMNNNNFNDFILRLNDLRFNKI